MGFDRANAHAPESKKVFAELFSKSDLFLASS
jgi:hypothetical protein